MEPVNESLLQKPVISKDVGWRSDVTKGESSMNKIENFLNKASEKYEHISSWMLLENM